MVEFYKDGQFCGDAKVKKLTSINGEMIEGTSSTIREGTDDTFPVKIIVDLRALNEQVDKSIARHL